MKISITKTIIVQNALQRPYIVEIQNAELPLSDFRIILRNANSIEKNCVLVMHDGYGTDYGYVNVPSDAIITLVVNPTETLEENEFDVTSSLSTVVTQWLNGELAESTCFRFDDANNVATSSSNTIVLERNVPIITSIAITTMPQLSFYTEDTFNYNGMVVTAEYSDGHTAVVTGYMVSNPNMSTAGIKRVIVLYTENHITKRAYYSINVILLEPTSIVAGINNRDFNRGDSFHPSTITATFNSGATRTVTLKCHFAGYNMDSVGYQTVTVAYIYNNTSVTTTYQILVKPLLVAAPSVSNITFSTPYQTSWQFTVTNPNDFPCRVIIYYSSSTPKYLEIGANTNLLINNTNAPELNDSIEAWAEYELYDDIYCRLDWNSGDMSSSNRMIAVHNADIIDPVVTNVSYSRDQFNPNNINYQCLITNNNPYTVKVHFATGFFSHDWPLNTVLEIDSYETLNLGTYGGDDYPDIRNVFERAVNGASDQFMCWFELEVPVQGGGTQVIKVSNDTIIIG